MGSYIYKGRLKPKKINKVQKWRIYKGLSQSEMSFISDIPMNVYRYIERNARALKKEEEQVLAKLFEISINQLYEGE